MRKLRALVLAGGLVLVTNLFILAGVLYNRSGGPEATLVLTERELPLGTVHEESPGLYLRLRWTAGRGGGTYEEPWLDRDKLESLGFDCSLDPGRPEAEEHYRRELARESFVVFEYEGAAWQEHLAAKREAPPAPDDSLEPRRPDWTRSALLQDSRLLAVDAGPDPGALRRLYPDTSRYLITRGLIRVLHVREPERREEGESPRVGGWIRAVAPEAIHIPPSLAGPLRELLPEEPAASAAGAEETPAALRGPRYDVTIHYGKRQEPWVGRVRLLREPGPGATPRDPAESPSP